MLETIREYITQPVVIKLIRSGVFFIIVAAMIFTIRRFLRRLKINDFQRRQYARWSTNILSVIYVFILVRIWALKNLMSYVENPTIEKLLQSVFVFFLVYIPLLFVRQLINSLKIEIELRHQYRKRANLAATILFVGILVPVWAGSMQQWATILSVMGAGVALALHEMLLNIAGWVYISIRRPYKTGDRIELGETRGDVIDIRVFQTSLLEIGNWVDADQSTGRVIHLPHGQIFRNPLFNYTKGFEYIWHEIPILVTFESDFDAAREMLLKIGEKAGQEVQDKVRRQIKKMEREYLIYYSKFTPIVYTKIEDSGVKLTLRYLCEAKRRRSIEDRVSINILKAFNDAPNIELAYPTYRIYKRGE